MCPFLRYCEFFFCKPDPSTITESRLLDTRVALAVSCLTFLTTIWGEGVVFTWLLNVTGISALLVWASIGLISIRFRRAYKAQKRSLSDLPYEQPLFPLLPISIVVLATLMFIAEGYASVRESPFEVKVRLRSCSCLFSFLFGYEQNVVATYIGVALYIVLYSGYTLYERFQMKVQAHFVPLLEVDFETDAVWKPGEGNIIRARERATAVAEAGRLNGRWKMGLAFITRHVY